MHERVPNLIDPCRICAHKGSCEVYARLKLAEKGDLDTTCDDVTLEWCDVSAHNCRLQMRLDCKRFEEEWDAT